MSVNAVREVVYFAGLHAGQAPDLPDLVHLGWKLRPAETLAGLLRLLRAHPGQRFVALLDLRGGHAPRDIATLAPALTASNVGWVACARSSQLEDEPVRQLIRDYCYDYVTWPCPEHVLATVIGHASGMASLALSHLDDHAEPATDEMIGNCAAMRQLYRALRKAALTHAPVFIAGDTGTGKELAAKAIHRHSTRHDRPFVAINCGAVPQNLIQSELFGYERGAFTGAQARKIGRIETAHGGTLFLDEIGDLPLESQATLLRFLQEGTFERVGGHEPLRIDVRIISATHQDLQAAIAEGRFRADLYHRLCVLRLQQPPLRERDTDIDLLADAALARYASEGRRLIRGFAPCAIRAMHSYAWPGNVRELINRVRQAVVMAEGRLIAADDLHLSGYTDESTQTLEEARNVAECTAIRQALQRNRNRLIDTARDLSVSRVTLYRLMERHGLRGAETHTAGAA